MKLEVRHLEMMQAIFEEGSVTKAASRLHLTQSALSHQLLGIERQLDAELFQRIGRKMSITPAGERLLNAARTVLTELRNTEHDISEKGRTPDGTLRISTECYTCYHWLPPHIKTLREQYPKIELRIVAEATHHPLQALLDNKIDVGIVSGRVRNTRISYVPLFKDELVVVTHPNHPLAFRTHIVAEDFRDENLIVYSVPRENLTVFQTVLVPAGVMPRTISHVQLTEAIIEMVKGGLGIGVLARWAVAPHVEAGTIATIPLTKRGIHRQWSAATLRGRPAAPCLKTFLNLLSTMPIVTASGVGADEGARPTRRRISA
jgi:LysR family transcriptional regulator, regulator for metE and metH